MGSICNRNWSLSRRWFVFVPVGVVLHDHLVVGEALLFPKDLVQFMGVRSMTVSHTNHNEEHAHAPQPPPHAQPALIFASM